MRVLDTKKCKLGSGVLVLVATLWGPAALASPGTASTSLFLPAVSYDSGGVLTFSLAVADLDGDGNLDVAAANCATSVGGCYQLTEGGTVSFLRGKGDGTFEAAVTYPSGGLGGQSVAAADVNGDKRPDLLVTNLFSNTVGVLLGVGNGTFKAAETYDSGGVNPMSVAVTDLNRDGKPDLIVANGCNAVLCSGGAVGVLLGNGDGTFRAAQTYTGFNAAAVSVEDLNGDRKMDLVVASGFFTVGVLLGNGDGTFRPIASYDAGGFGSNSVAIADVNGDRELDLAVSNCAPDATSGCGGTSSNGVVGVLLGNGDGTFRPVVTYDSGGKDDSSVAIADVGGDGTPDLFVAHGCDASGACGVATVSQLSGRGDGTFQSPVTFSSGRPSAAGALSVKVADLNGDCRSDLVVANGDSIGVLLQEDRPGPRGNHRHRNVEACSTKGDDEPEDDREPTHGRGHGHSAFR